MVNPCYMRKLYDTEISEYHSLASASAVRLWFQWSRGGVTAVRSWTAVDELPIPDGSHSPTPGIRRWTAPHSPYASSNVLILNSRSMINCIRKFAVSFYSIKCLSYFQLHVLAEVKYHLTGLFNQYNTRR